MSNTRPARRRASRYLRPQDPRRFQLTQRDKLVVKAVNDFRVMRQDQIQRLLFPSKNTAQVRLRLLWEHGVLRRRFFLSWVEGSPAQSFTKLTGKVP